MSVYYHVSYCIVARVLVQCHIYALNQMLESSSLFFGHKIIAWCWEATATKNTYCALYVIASVCCPSSAANQITTKSWLGELNTGFKYVAFLPSNTNFPMTFNKIVVDFLVPYDCHRSVGNSTMPVKHLHLINVMAHNNCSR